MPTITKPWTETARKRLAATKSFENLEWVENEIRHRLQQLDLAEVPALKLYADIQRWKIDKVLPTPKAVELSGQLAVDQTIRITVG